MKTSELTGAALDWAVAKCEGKTPSLFIFRRTGQLASAHHYSTDWAQGGPIIEREKIGLLHAENTLPHQRWDAGETDETPNTLWALACGATPLIAAMRTYVRSKLGDEVEIPIELTKGE
jgi:hypothetical protein